MAASFLTRPTRFLIPISKPSHVSPESLHSPVALYIPLPRASQNGVSGLWPSASLYVGLFERDECACLSSHTIIAPTNIFNGRTLLNLFNSSSSLPLAIGISVPVGVTTHYCLVTVDTGHVPRNTTSYPPNANYRTPNPLHACVTLHSIPILRSSSARATLSSGVHLLVSLRYEVPIKCLKVNSIPRRLTRRLISTFYNTTPRRWRAPQSNTGNRDRRTTIYKRLRSGSSRSAIFLTETLRLRTTCVVRRKPLQFETP